MRIRCEKCGVSYNHWEDHACKIERPAIAKLNAGRVDEMAGDDFKHVADYSDRLEKGICSACGQKIRPKPLTSAEKQRRYRERKKNG